MYIIMKPIGDLNAIWYFSELLLILQKKVILESFHEYMEFLEKNIDPQMITYKKALHLRQQQEL